MKPVLGRERSRRLDQAAIHGRGVHGLVLMENAGRGASDVLAEHFPDGPVVVVCGAGNNAGDGYVLARRLLTLGRAVSVVATTPLEDLRGDAVSNAAAYVALGGPLTLVPEGEFGEGLGSTLPSTLPSTLREASVLVDALFGTGLSRPIEGREASLIEQINALDVPVLALDLPSGICADTGCTLGVAIRAELTVAFATHKCGLLTPNGAAHAGSVRVVDIGVPVEPLLEGSPDARTIEAGDAAQLLLARAVPGHKGESGRVLLVAGAPGTVGAARLAALGCHRAGAGLVTVVASPDAAAQLDSSTWETMTARLDPADVGSSLRALLTRQHVVAAGPGLGREPQAHALLKLLLEEWSGPLVLDADALNAYAGRAERLARARGKLILTPHPVEAARLLGCEVEQIEADRYGKVQRLAGLTRAVVLLKGAHTLVSDGDQVLVNMSGNAALAVGGAGDVLTGVVAALAVHLSPLEAASAAVWLHGRAGELWSAEQGTTRGMLAREVAERVPRALAELSG